MPRRTSGRSTVSRASLAVAFLIAMAGSALAVSPDERLEDPALEARAQEIGRGVRCVVCRSQSIDESDAPLAKDLRLVVRERIVAGDSDAQVRAFLAARYGDYVLLRPRVTASTIALWAAPATLLLVGIGIGIGVLGARKPLAAAAALTEAEEEALRNLSATPSHPNRTDAPR